MARVDIRQAMYRLICFYQVVPLPLLKALLFAGSTAFSLELMKGKKVLFLSSTSCRFLIGLITYFGCRQDDWGLLISGMV